MLEQPQEHTMRLEHTHPSGAEEWYCPTCGRRLLFQWPPNYKRVVLETGDDYAIHSASKGGLRMGRAQMAEATGEAVEDDKRLESWEQWLEEVDFGDWQE